jgi:hypothetical protein
MKLFGLQLGKEKAVPFQEFRDMVRLAVRRRHANATVENTETGFILTIDGKKQACNLRNLYFEYARAPQHREEQIGRWLHSLITEIPEHGWAEASLTLRPTLKHTADYVEIAQRYMEKATPPDSLPYTHFIGDLAVIVMRDLPGTAVAVTQAQLEAWGVSFEEAMRMALNNLNMLGFPSMKNSLMAGSGGRKGEMQEEVGLVFEGDHLTSTWLVVDRFRDYITQRLLGDFVVSVPIRSRLVAIRADEQGLIGQIQQSGRNMTNQAHALTPQLYHISSATTGGVVTVHQGAGLAGEAERLSAGSLFAKGGSSALPTGGVQPVGGGLPAQPGFRRPIPVDLSTWGGLTETTGDDPSPPTPFGRGRR